MTKLYKKIDGITHYWETWEDDDRTSIIHWGIIGEEGDSKEVKSSLLSPKAKVVKREMNEKMQEGYAELDDQAWISLEIEFKIDGFGSEADLEKRHELEEILNELLGWTGLGEVDGGSIGSGTMEVGCMVVDFKIAKELIERKLQNTPFSDYSRIFDLDAEIED